MFTYQDIFSNKQSILFVVAHPDDILVSFGGLLNQLKKDNKDIFVITVSNGSRGSKDTVISEEALAKQRIEE